MYLIKLNYFWFQSFGIYIALDSQQAHKTEDNNHKKGEKMTTLKQINEDSFKNNVLESKLPVLVDFLLTGAAPVRQWHRS